ncbi:MAG: hypothetical protein FJ009_17495 [Chloroflexi bacterium]|nr:hypothetical protein [Chloroflexota bacterium]
MTIQAIRLNLPDNLLRRLTETAEATQQSVDDVLLQTIRAGLPPNLERVPQRFHADLRWLNRLDDDTLRRVAASELDADKTVEYETLLEQNQRAQLTGDQNVRLNVLREEADLMMFRRAYAFALLKWRGNPNSESVVP